MEPRETDLVEVLLPPRRADWLALTATPIPLVVEGSSASAGGHLWLPSLSLQFLLLPLSDMFIRKWLRTARMELSQTFGGTLLKGKQSWLWERPLPMLSTLEGGSNQDTISLVY